MSLFARRMTGVGAILLLIVVVGFGVVRPSNPFADRYGYYATFDSVQGLGAIDRDVRVAGVKVGTVGDVERRGDDVRVELTLNENIVLHRDARAAMRPHTLFEGSNFIDLSPGSPSAEVMKEGQTIPRSQTTNYVTLDKALRVLRPDIRDNLQTLAQVGSQTLRGEAVSGIQHTLRKAPRLVADIAPAARAARGTDGDELAGAIRGLSDTADALERQAHELGPLVERTNRTAAALTADAARPLDATLAALPGTLHQLRASAPAVTGVVRRTERLAREIEPALPVLAPALRDATPIVRATIPVAQQATPLVRDARLIASRLAEARAALVEMFRLTEPSLDKFESLLGVFNAPTEIGAPSGVAQLVGGAFSGFNAVFRPFQTRAQNPNAPGHSGRIGVYVNPAGLRGLTDSLGLPTSPSPLLRGTSPPCAKVSEVSARAAREMQLMEMCE